jgi:ABC-type Fe3+-citrate transport system substrate-binding protein
MSDEPENLVLRHLREIRATLDEHTKALARIEKQLSDQAKVVTYSLGQSTETQFRQSQQESRIDEVFQKLEELLSRPEPVE